MPKSHRPYPREFKQRIVELIRNGRKPEELARQFEPSAQRIRNWVRQADREEGHERERRQHSRPSGARPWSPCRDITSQTRTLTA